MADSVGQSIAKSKFDDFKHDANEVIEFRLIRSTDDLDNDDGIFSPEMTHQLFGDSESIFGYKDLQVQIYFTAARMLTYVDCKYSEKVQPENSEGLEADDVVNILAEHLQPGFFTNLDDFVLHIEKDKIFKPFGELKHSYTVDKDGNERKFEVWHCTTETAGFKEYHERIQPFLLFYVDAASYIEIDDDRWDFYVVYEKYQANGQIMYAFVGYMSVYNYYAYPERIRPRVSQVLILPPFQRQGHGTALLQTFFTASVNRSEVLDITVEDSSERLQRVRDFIDVRNCLNLKSFGSEKIHEGFSDDMERDAQQKLKINKKQAKRVYEILRLKHTDCSNKEQYRSYRLEIKKRLNVPFQENGRSFKKLQKALDPMEFAATMNNFPLEQRLQFLDAAFEECVDEYRHILEQVAAAI